MTTAEYRASVLDRVLAQVPSASNGARAWGLVDPGTVPWLLRQASDLGQLHGLLRDPEFLVHADPARLMAAVDESDEPSGTDFAIYRHDAAKMRLGGANERRQLLVMNAARYGRWELLNALSDDHPAAVPWVPTWFDARERMQSLFRAMAVPGPEIERVASTRIGSRILVAALTADGVVSVWDAFQEEPYGLPWPVTGHQVGSLALCTWAGRTVGVAGTLDGEVLVRDILAGETLRRFSFDGLRGARVAGTTNQAGSTTIAAIAFSEEETGELRAWDLSTGEVVAQHRSSAASFVAITALQTPDGPLVAVGDFSGRVGFLSLEGPVHWPERRHDMPVAGLVAGVVGDRPLVTSTDVFGGIVVWDPVTRLPLDLRVPLSRRGSPPVSIADIHGVPRLLIGGTIGFRCANLVDATVDERSAGGPRLLTALATVRDRGRDFALVGGGNQLQLFDLEVADPAPAEQVLTPYTGLATTQVAGQPLVITVDQDSQVRVVDAATGARTAVSTGQEADWAAAVDGTSWVALGSFREPRGTGVSLVDLATGRSRAVPRSNPDRPVSALAAAAIGQNVVVATGNRAGQVEVWFSHEDGVHLYSPHQEELTTSTLVFATLSGLLVLVSGNADGTIAVMDVASRRLLGRRAAHRDVVSALALSGEVIISGSYSGEIRSWQGPGLEPGSQVTQAHGGKVNSLTVPPARWAQVVSSGDDAVLRSWSLEDLSPISSTVLPAPIQAVVATDTGLVAAMGRELLHLRPASGSTAPRSGR